MAAIPKCPNQSPGPILESKGMCAIFQKKGKKGQNIWTFGQKCKKTENILKKGSIVRATIALLEMSWRRYLKLQFLFHFRGPRRLFLFNAPHEHKKFQTISYLVENSNHVIMCFLRFVAIKVAISFHKCKNIHLICLISVAVTYKDYRSVSNRLGC